MRISLTHVGARFPSNDAFDTLTRQYVDRCAAFADCRLEHFPSLKAWLDWVARREARTAPVVVLLDSRGRTMPSEAFAVWLGGRRDEGAQHIVFAIGPASGWSDEARQRANLVLSFGPMTMAHALARLVLAEQVYRAFTILAGHPYHCGH
jgi:23S rRNA (pseudouridine1915-N3)-methyltransferase